DWAPTIPGFNAAAASTQLQTAPEVKWGEADQALQTTKPAAATGIGAKPHPGSLAVAASTSKPAPVRSPSQPQTASLAAPPSGCSAKAGLNAGQPNDPLYCSEPPGPFSSREKGNIFFSPTHTAPQPPHA